MLVILTCTCGNSENLVRSSLHRYKYDNWAMEPITKGKSSCLQKVEDLIRDYPDNTDIKDLFAHIKNSSKWVIFLGYDENSSKWADVGHGQMKADAEAEAIVNRYGK